ncbi:MAG: phosphatidylserine decarboxylase [Elusimicrobia bacterium]|nr:phosphatidylserine decarboxylase [Elusimicrobiota bacterium]
MKIASQGWRFVVPAAAIGLVGLGLLRRPGAALFGALIALLGLGFAAFCLYFFRDPERVPPADPDKIYAPGDGVVLSAAREGEGDTVTLRIFLSIFNVHVQRAPCAGSVLKVETIPGSFAAAMKHEARGNARVVMTLDPGAGRKPLVVEQIAGLIARRIECWAKPGDRVESGARYGIIYFGSQAAVRFPAGARCTAKPGDRVAGGLTEIGEWTSTR